MKSRFFTLPNIITVFRLVLIPVFVFLFCYLPEHRWAALICFVTACVSDVVDGWIARRYNLVSDIGALLDPFADKLMYITVGLCLVLAGTLLVWFYIVYLLKELSMIVLAAYLAKGESVVIHAKWYGKLATVLLFVIISVSIVWPAGISTLWLNAAFGAVLLLAVFAYVKYGLLFIAHFKNKKSSENTDADSVKE